MTTTCAWCKKIMRVTTDHPGLVSHGICPECAAVELNRYGATHLRVCESCGKEYHGTIGDSLCARCADERDDYNAMAGAAYGKRDRNVFGVSRDGLE